MKVTQLTRPRYAAALGLVLAAAGSIVVACGSDSTPSEQNTTGGNEPAAGTGGTTSTTPPTGEPSTPSGEAPPTGATPSNGGSGSEAPPSEVPITGSENPPTTGEGSGEVPPPPPAASGPVLPGSTANCAAAEGPVPTLALEEVATAGLEEPIFVTGAPGDDSRLFVLERAGRVRVIVDGQLQEEPFIDISSQVTTTFECGLLGMAFHPDYATNGLFYLHFSTAGGNGLTACDGVVAEFQANADNRSTANAASQRQVLVVDQPQQNHNGGMITFGPDRQLWLGFGDGGNGNDVGAGHAPGGNGQALNTPLGKMLRIDVDARDVGGAYGISSGNMAGDGINPEIWALGLRNPWRFSFDACNGDLYIADVGQSALEEVDYLPANSPAGTNFGWPVMEASQCGPQGAGCDPNDQRFTRPIDEYPPNVGRSITGGYVYRGSSIPGLRGNYLYADYASGRFFRFRVENGQVADRVEITAELTPVGGSGNSVASFGQDNAGEVYVVSFDPSGVFRVTTAP